VERRSRPLKGILSLSSLLFAAAVGLGAGTAGGARTYAARAPQAVVARDAIRAATVRSETLDQSSQLVVGTPVQTEQTPVLMLSCGLRFGKPPGSPNQTVTYSFSVYNQEPKKLRYVAVTDRFDRGNFQGGFIFNLNAHEFRRVAFTRSSEDDAGVAVLLAARPTFYLCGTGPDQGADGTVYPFASMSLTNNTFLLSTKPGDKNGVPISPFATMQTIRFSGKASAVIGIPIQPLALKEWPSFRTGVPGINLLPVVVTACSVTMPTHAGHRAPEVSFSLYNQTPRVVPSAQLSVAVSGRGEIARVYGLRAYEYRTAAFPADERLESALWARGVKVMGCRASVPADP